MIRTTLWLLPLILFLVSWGVLRHGLRLDRLELGGFQVEKLYLKLDKRLHLKARRVVIPRQKDSAGPEALQRGLERLHRALGFFDDIELDDVEFVDRRYRLIYRERIIYIDGDEFEIAGMVYNRGGEMEVQFPLVRIPRYDVTLSGELHYRYRDGTIEASGFYKVPDLAGAFRVTKMGERIRFRLDSMETGSLKRLLGLFTMSREAREWLGRRIAAERYRLEYLEGTGRYDMKKGEFLPDLERLYGAVRLRKLRIRFHDTLKPITARSARVVMKRGNLYFLLEAPRYGGRDLSGSQAALLNLNDPERLTLLLRLYYRGRVDWQVLKILHTYGLNLTLGQKEGRTRARVDLDIPLGKGEVKIRGIARFGKGVLEFQKQPIRVGGGEVAFTSKLLALRGLSIREPWLLGQLDGRVNLRKRRAKLTMDAERFRLATDGETYLLIRKKKIPLELKWTQKSRRIDFPTLKATLHLGEGETFRFDVGKISLWRPYLQGFLKLAAEGKLTIERRGRGEYRIGGTLLWPDSPFYTREGPVEEFPFQARFVGKALRFDALRDKIAFRSGQRVLRIDSLNVNAERLMEIVRQQKKEAKNEAVTIRLSVLGKKSMIRYGKFVLLTDAYRLDIDGQRIRFDGALGEDHVWLERRGETLRVEAKRIGDRMLHSLIHFNGLQEGRYTLHLEGTQQKGYTGEILIEGGVLRDVKAYNDMIALFNTIPALVSFSSPGFSRKGFELKKGRILFTLKGEELRLGSILLEGKSATVAGKGIVDLKSKALDIELAVQTAREMGKTLGEIPVVGYILFGKDKSLTAGVKITGTLERPKVRTNPVGEVLLYPLQLLKRTLMAPMQMGYDESPGPMEEKKAASTAPAARRPEQENKQPPSPAKAVH
jgi:hypothetical protein